MQKFMKERFDPKTQDIFLYLTKDELSDFLDIEGIFGMKLVNHEKKVQFLLYREPHPSEVSSRVIDVQAAYDVPGKTGLYTNFLLTVSDRGCEQLATQGLCSDRYTGLTGSEKVHVLIEEEPETKS